MLTVQFCDSAERLRARETREKSARRVSQDKRNCRGQRA